MELGSATDRGRIVMLVDNDVENDSRVQKTARSAADAGWDVILLGRGLPARTWTLGRAEVRLIAMPVPLSKPKFSFRRRWLRGPLGYPPTGIAPYRHQWVKAKFADLEVREAAQRLAARAGQPVSPVRRARLSGRRLATMVERKWVSLRYWQLNRAPRTMSGPWDRMWTSFWQKTMGDRAWRRLAPHLWDFELAFGPVVDELRPDIIHANDFRMLGVGARAAIRARARGRDVKLVWDAHEFTPGITTVDENARWHPGICAHEREYAPYADAVITVSELLAEMLEREHNLPERPGVVLNAPDLRAGDDRGDAGPVPDLRELCGVGPTVPLLVYSGAAAKQRGLDTMIEGLPHLDGVHVALVVNGPTSAYLLELLARAEELGVADRVHALPYVPYGQVVPFLAAADVAVSPVHRWPNYEISLTTKFLEYSHARLPIVVSDVRTMSETVRATGQGEVYVAGEVDDYVRAVRAVLAEPARYRAAYDKPGLLDDWTWAVQAETLLAVYDKLAPMGNA